MLDPEAAKEAQIITTMFDSWHVCVDMPLMGLIICGAVHYSQTSTD